MRDRVAVRRCRINQLLFAAALVCCCVDGFANAQAQTKVSAGMVAPGPTYWPLYVAEDLGFFKQGDITVENYSAGANIAQELTAGSLDVGQSGFPDFMRATYNGAPLKIVMETISVPPFAVYGKTSIKSVSQLKGKIISIAAADDINIIYMTPFLASGGLKRSDVDFVYAKASGARFAALVAGGVDAAILNPPTSFKAASLGFTNLGEISDVMKTLPFTVWAANTNWASKHKGALIAFTKASQRAVEWLYDPRNENQAIDILVKDAKVDRDDAKKSYDYYMTQLHAFNKDGLISKSSFLEMATALVQLGDIKKPVPPLSSFFDASYLQGSNESDKQ